MLYNTYTNNYYILWDDYWRSYRINSEAAVEIALKRVPGQFLKVELYYEDGVLVYEIDIRTLNGIYEVKVAADTGGIFKVEKELD